MASLVFTSGYVSFITPGVTHSAACEDIGQVTTRSATAATAARETAEAEWSVR